MTASRATVRAVVEHAKRLAVLAEKQEAADPWLAGKMWQPTTAGARQQFARELTGVRLDFNQRGDEAADDELVAEAVRRTIAWMDSKVVLEQVERTEHARQADRARKRHHRRQTENVRDLEAHRRSLTVGQRIDAALAELSRVGNAQVAAMDADRVSGGKTDDERWPGPGGSGDPSGSARHKVIECVRFVENELENARRRRVELERPA